MARFTVQYQPAGTKRVKTVGARSWDAAAHTAVALARGHSRAVTILRYDRDSDDAGWSVAGLVRDMEGRAPEPHVFLLQDVRTPVQREHDLATDRAAGARRAALDATQPVGWRSRMRVLGVARVLARAAS